jgi:UDP-N-acetylmuramyl pentapeptide synthase
VSIGDAVSMLRSFGVGDVALVKGSRVAGLDRVVDAAAV